MYLRFSFFIAAAFTVLSCSKTKDAVSPVTTQSPIKAEFSYSISNDGQLPAKIDFTNGSTNANTYQWSSGNGLSSTSRDVSFTFDSAGTYPVKLVVTNGDQKDSITKQVQVNPVKYKVRIFLVTPQGESFNQAYDAIKMCARNLQSWYKTEMGGKTFTLTDHIVDTVRGQHNYAWYNQNNGSISGTDPRYYGWYNTLSDMKTIVGSEFDSPLYINVVYVAAFFEGAGAAGYTALGDTDLKGLLGLSSDPVNRWIGGSGHEWGHAFGLPHPPSPNNSLMWTGYTIYPATFLNDADKNILNQSKFFNLY